MTELPPFPGFRPEAFEFLSQLAANNSRDWFKPRKATYDDEIVWPMHCLLTDVSREAAIRGLPLTANPKRAMFRIYRDTRFSKNKDPYKTAAGAVLSQDGTSKGFGGIYIHLEPEQCFLGAGFWNPDKDRLRSWRNYMVGHSNDFMEMTERLAAVGLELQNYGEPLKRMPRGYETHAGTELEPYLKWKSFTTSRTVNDADMQKAEFTADVMRFIEETYPLLDFGWKTV